MRVMINEKIIKNFKKCYDIIRNDFQAVKIFRIISSVMRIRWRWTNATYSQLVVPRDDGDTNFIMLSQKH